MIHTTDQRSQPTLLTVLGFGIPNDVFQCAYLGMTIGNQRLGIDHHASQKEKVIHGDAAFG